MDIVTKRYRLLELIKEYIHDDYSIGFHGVDKHKNNNTSASVHGVLVNVLKNGLNIYSGRTLLGTSQFLNEEHFKDEEDFITNYKYGDVREYIVIALPKILRNSKGEEIYLGYPTYNSNRDAPKGYEISSLADLLLPDYKEDVSLLFPEFILGKLVVDKTTTFTPNKNHMSLHGNIVSDELFDKCKKMMQEANKFYGVEINYQINSDEDCELNTEIIEEEYEKVSCMSDQEKQKIEEELQKLDYHTRMVITSYPIALRNTLTLYNGENRGFNR